jgi:hypothetical protein
MKDMAALIFYTVDEKNWRREKGFVGDIFYPENKVFQRGSSSR